MFCIKYLRNISPTQFIYEFALIVMKAPPNGGVFVSAFGSKAFIPPLIKRSPDTAPSPSQVSYSRTVAEIDYLAPGPLVRHPGIADTNDRNCCDSRLILSGYV